MFLEPFQVCSNGTHLNRTLAYPLPKMATCQAKKLFRKGWERNTWIGQKVTIMILCLYANKAFSNKDKKDQITCAHLSVFAQLRPTICDPMDLDYQSPLSMGFPRQEYWSGLPFSFPVDFLNARTKPAFPALQANSLLMSHLGCPKRKWSLSIVSNSLWPSGLSPTRLLPPWDFPGKSTGVGCHCLLRK